MRKYGLLATFICAPVLFACSDNQNVDTAKADKDKAVKVESGLNAQAANTVNVDSYAHVGRRNRC